MKFIGGESLSEEEQQRMVDADRQRRRLRHALLPKRDLIAAIRRARHALGRAPGGDVPPLSQRNGTELAEIMMLLEDFPFGHPDGRPRCSQSGCSGSGLRLADGVAMGHVHNSYACTECAERAGVILAPIPGHDTACVPVDSPGEQ